MAPGPHVYEVSCRWLGDSTARPDYERSHVLSAPEVADHVTLSSGGVFGGDDALLNPEDLLVAAASSCQMLSFLAAARRRKLDVTAYSDRATGVMPKASGPMAIERITLRPEIAVTGPHDREVLDRLLEEAHSQCFVANSLRSQVVLEPTWHTDTD